MFGRVFTSIMITGLALLLLTNSAFCANVWAADQMTNREEVISTLEKAIATKYYDYKKRRIIRVYLNDFSSTLQDNGLLKDYFYEGVMNSLKEGHQFVIGDFDDVGADCLLSMSFESLGKQFAKINAEVMDAQTGRVVAAVSKTYPLDTFNEQAFVDFKQNHGLKIDQARKIGKTRLVVFVNSSGKSVDEYEIRTSTYSSTRNTTGQSGSTYDDSQDYSATGNSDYSRQSDYTGKHEYKEKVGRSSIYPSDIVVYVNNRPYKPNSEGIAFDQLVTPGTYKVNVKFRKALWDGVRKNEIKGRSFSRKFQLDMKKDDYTRFDVSIRLKGDNAEVAGVKRKLR